jgi:hypothetical protein
MAKNSFAAMANGSNKFTRKFGTEAGEVMPYISGRGFVHFSTIPANLYQVVNYHKGDVLISNNDEIKNILESAVISTNVPGKQVNTAEFTGLGGITWSVPTSVTSDNTLNMRFIETSGLPILSIFHAWVRMIQDNRAGVSLLVGDNYSKSNYASNVYYWTTKPDGVTVEYAACYTGVLPTKDPADLYGYDLASLDKVEVDMDFRCDWVWEEDWVYTRCRDLAQVRKANAFPVAMGQLSSTAGEINTAYRPSDA